MKLLHRNFVLDRLISIINTVKADSSSDSHSSGIKFSSDNSLFFHVSEGDLVNDINQSQQIIEILFFSREGKPEWSKTLE